MILIDIALLCITDQIRLFKILDINVIHILGIIFKHQDYSWCEMQADIVINWVWDKICSFLGINDNMRIKKKSRDFIIVCTYATWQELVKLMVNFTGGPLYPLCSLHWRNCCQTPKWKFTGWIYFIAHGQQPSPQHATDSNHMQKVNSGNYSTVGYRPAIFTKNTGSTNNSSKVLHFSGLHELQLGLQLPLNLNNVPNVANTRQWKKDPNLQ